jgi:hypothetical protein
MVTETFCGPSQDCVCFKYVAFRKASSGWLIDVNFPVQNNRDVSAAFEELHKPLFSQNFQLLKQASFRWVGGTQ